MENVSCSSTIDGLVAAENRREKQPLPDVSGKTPTKKSRRFAARRSVQMKVRKLQRLIPGGRGLGPDRLFLQTADYILFLRSQVNVLQALSKL